MELTANQMGVILLGLNRLARWYEDHKEFLTEGAKRDHEEAVSLAVMIRKADSVVINQEVI